MLLHEDVCTTYILIPQVLLRNTFDVSGGNSIHGKLDLLGSHAATTRDELPAEVLGNGSRAVEAEQQACLELALCALDLHILRANRHACPLLEGEVRKVVQVHEVLGHKVDAPEAGVRVRRREGHEAVREVVGRDNVGELRGHQRRGAERAVPVAHDGLHDEHGEVVRRAPADTLDGDGNVRGGHGVVTDTDFRADELGLRMRETAKGNGVGGDG